MRIGLIKICLAFAVSVFCSAPVSFASDLSTSSSSKSIQLPLRESLMEISGLAAAGTNSVYAHNDEHAIIYRLNLDTGKANEAFALGSPTVSGDFEGIAVTPDWIYLITSTGYLYEAEIGGHKDRVRYNIYDTGAGDFCEVEGLSMGPPLPDASPSFLIVCKTPVDSTLRKRLVVYKWDLASHKAVTTPWLNLDASDIVGSDDVSAFRPSGIDYHAQTGEMIIVAAANRRLVTLSQDGTVLSNMTLPIARHRQAEGIAIMPSGEIVIADEGGRTKPGMLTIYGR